jgi:hypothetical protein
MSGKLECIIREGKSRDSNYSGYCYWSTKATDESTSNTIICTPSYAELIDAICEYLCNELYNDITRDRNPDFLPKLNLIRDSLNALENFSKTINKEDVPEKYFRVNTKIEDKEKYYSKKYGEEIKAFKNNK